MDSEAEEYFSNKEWIKALDAYNKLLLRKSNTDHQILSYLFYRTECLHQLGKHEEVIDNCRRILKLLEHTNDRESQCRTRIQLIRSLFSLERFSEGEFVISEWLIQLKRLTNTSMSNLSLESILSQFFVVNNSDKGSRQVWLSKLERKLSTMAPNGVFCIYCNLFFADKAELSSHCQTQEHETMVMSDEGHDWHCRAPPRGLKPDLYAICVNWKETKTCRFGVQCVEAHGEEELMEWKQRFQYREMKLLKAKEKELFGKSYTEELLEKWAQTANIASIMRERIDDVEDTSSCTLSATVTSKNSNHKWLFTMNSKKSLKAIALLQDTHRNHFYISRITAKQQEAKIKNSQEWINSKIDSSEERNSYEISVIFQTSIFGTFRQTVVFDFGSEPVLVKHLCVDVVPDSDFEKINEIRNEIKVSISERWTSKNCDVVSFSSTLVPSGDNDEWYRMLKLMYPCPESNSFELSNATVSEKKITKNNYKERMNQLLWVEEIARYNLIAQYNLSTKLQIAHSYLLAPNSNAASTAKFSGNGELFASVSLGKELSEDTSEGRLILMQCRYVYFRPNCAANSNTKKVYEALIEDKGKNMIYLRLSSQTVAELRLTPDTDFEVQIQFQLNRTVYSEWHYTLDNFPNFKMIFPETYLEPSIPWSPTRQWSLCSDIRLNVKQKEAVLAITTPLSVRLPPILVIGPYGTGKTFTLAQAIRELVKEDASKILLCTHSNSAADLYIKDYLDPLVESGNEQARPFRIYYQRRWVTTVSPVVQKYCSIRQSGNTREFQFPTHEDIAKHKIIVVTTSTSIYLSAMKLPPGTFTHILLDEAAQALECETITPLALATENTRIVLAGDHMQLGPDIFSKFAKERNLHISLLERLYDHYPSPFSCKILLCENYRAHETIIQFTSESFYDQKLVSSRKQPMHFKFHPLTFFTTRGEDVQDKNSTAFYNNSEVYEVVERVAELKRNWPKEWGECDDQAIGVVTPYADQVFRIRSELKKRRINVCVERVLNVQGKQFRAIILSTVRTRKTCNDSSESGAIDYGFLSNLKLLNTAITRAQSLVAVVGDPIALCSLGRCRKVWERFIQICSENGSLFGITWTDLKFQLDGIELKKIYTLNPLAPEFIPRKYKERMADSVKVFCRPVNNVHSNAIVMPPLPLRPYPVVYHQQPYVYNIPVTNNVTAVQQAPPLPLLNGYRSLGMINHSEIPYVRTIPRHPAAANVPSSSKPASSLRHPQPAPQQPQHPKFLQFMNNVHFPESPVFNDCINLLPKEMSLADMIMQPASVQEYWYHYLAKNVGQEAAQKFKYLLHTSNQKGSRVPDQPHLFGRSTPLSSDSPTFNWFDSPSNQINFNKPIYMREVENNWTDLNKSNPLYKRRASSLEPTPSTSSMSNGIRETDVQRHINEEFASMSITNQSVDDFSDILGETPSANCFASSARPLQESCEVSVPRFYKYWSSP